MLSSETKEDNMEFKIDDYDLQAEGTCGDFQWSFGDGNLWVYKDWEDAEYNYRIETNVQIEPFSSEEDIKHKVIAVIANCYDPLCQQIVCLNWKASMKEKEEPTVMSILWSIKLMKEYQKLFLIN